MICLLFAMLVFDSDEKESFLKSGAKSEERNEAVVVKIEEDEYIKKTSNYFGVNYARDRIAWRARRHSKIEKKYVYNGTYNDEETAARASDTLGRKLITNGEKGHKLNFPDDNIEIYPEERANYIGVSYNKRDSKWFSGRRCKNKKMVYNGASYKDQETAAHASDTVARKLIANGEKGHKLNFPEDDTEVYPEKTSSYIGVGSKGSRWRVSRWSKTENKAIYNGTYKDEETAARASDTLARELIANGEKGHKLNFQDDVSDMLPKEYQQKKRKRQENLQDN